jgi:3-dehydrotetronate 4-kinase
MNDPSPGLLVGAIADDFTGASDLADTLARGGMRTVQTIGVPPAGAGFGEHDALVVALKSRSIPAADAVAQSLSALDALRARGARLILFKYCSTFDSTDAGNIGPVADALLDALGETFTIACPAFPANGRRLFNGYLFVHDVLLSESGMRDHPLTPMRDANLVRVLSRQTPHRVGHIDFAVVRRGRTPLTIALRAAREAGIRHAIVDAVDENDLRAIGGAALDAQLGLITGGSGIATGLPDAFRERGLLAAAPPSAPASAAPSAGMTAILAGSCSRATRAQVAFGSARWPTFDLSERELDDPDTLAEEALAWAAPLLDARPVLITASAAPERVAENQRRYGADDASARVERILATIARGLRRRGVGRFIVAGGETSGAIVEALGVEALRIGSAIAPGVPWTTTFADPPLALALKSGNFGGEDFFLRAWETAP